MLQHERTPCAPADCSFVSWMSQANVACKGSSLPTLAESKRVNSCSYQPRLNGGEKPVMHSLDKNVLSVFLI